MKDIKSMMIGFLLATWMFLLMGQSSNDSQVGRYQGVGAMGNLYLVDTTTGKTMNYERSYSTNRNVWKTYIQKVGVKN